MNDQNLRPHNISSTEQAREMGRKGGKASAKAKKEKKHMSQIYGEFLAEKFSVTVDGERQETTGAAFLSQVVKKVLVAGGSPAVSMMKEIREATEGTKAALTGADGAALFPNKITIELVRDIQEPDNAAS